MYVVKAQNLHIKTLKFHNRMVRSRTWLKLERKQKFPFRFGFGRVLEIKIRSLVSPF